MNKEEHIHIKGFSSKKFISFILFFILGLGASFLAKEFIPYVAQNPVAMFVIFPVISIPLCLFTLTRFPKCPQCKTKTKPAPTKKGSEFDNLKCPRCEQHYKIDSLIRR